MARKPRSEWSDTYRRRVERAEARGLTRQQARGHKEPREYHRRAVREFRTRGITSDQLRTVRNYAERRASKNKALNPQELIDWARDNGYAQFKAVRNEQRSLVRNYRAQKKARIYKPTEIGAFGANVKRHGTPNLSSGGSAGLGDIDRGGRGDVEDYGGSDYVSEDDVEDDGDYYGDDDDYYDADDLSVEWFYYHDD